MKKIILIRRVVGQSMLPGLKPNSLVLATGYFKLEPEHVVVIRHKGIEKIKRVQKISRNKIFVVGDNPRASLDSRSFGWLPLNSIVAKVVWPRLL